MQQYSGHFSSLEQTNFFQDPSQYYQFWNYYLNTSGNYLNTNVPYSIGFLNLPAFLVFVPITTFMAKIGAETVHKFNKRLIGRIFGTYLFIVACKLFYDYFSF